MITPLEEGDSDMRFRRLFCCVLLLGYAGCKEGAGPPPQRPVVSVSLATVVTKDVPVQVQGIGNVEAYSTVTVKSQVNGEFIGVYFSQGQEGRKGHAIF